ncbi:tetratricopeptide repeat protein [Flavobacterium maritimum]|uniref:type IX secretion system periplasmic lipoprotein PorW/SprE n=1 Tax=Flavobacterium maritimum TaxID=3149042 RepID=UPI003F68DD62
MKINTFKYLYILIFLFFLIACSTKKDTFLARNSHALSTEYNILYNGQIGLDKGIAGIKANTIDNFWKRLPIERMLITDDFSPEGKPKNTDFELAETKATKAIQKHSMNIGGYEKNSQIDEAYLLLGKARYYDQRFIPALDAFNYILYKYPNSSNIYTAKIWREKTNMRLGNDALVIKNINKLLKDQDLKDQVYADANALLSEAFLNLEEKDSAITKLKIAEDFTKVNAERVRYRFVLGQLYQELNKRDSAIYFYQSVIDMNRKAERKYVIQAYAKKAQLFDYENGDKEAFVERYNKLVEDRENRPFLDVIYHEMGVFYDKYNDQELAMEFYNASLKTDSKDPYLNASNYRNLGNMYFRNTDYSTAAKYYDSTLVKLDVKTREYAHIQKTRKNLDEVIKYEAIAKRNDSILKVVSLSDIDRMAYFENYIDTLKKVDETKRILEEKQKETLANIERNSKSGSSVPEFDDGSGKPKKSSFAPPSGNDASVNESGSIFYFYNPKTVEFGKLEFKKIYGNRTLSGNWRFSGDELNKKENDTLISSEALTENAISQQDTIIEKYTTDFYLKQLPTTQTAIDSIGKERNFAYYQLGIIYKEKFKEYQLASTKLEQLLQQNPEEKLILPAMYNLFKIYQITDVAKAEEMKNRISTQYPNSRYAQIINKTGSNDISANETPEMAYNKLYKLYQEEQFVTVLEKSEELINQYPGDEIVSKFELLKANAIAKLQGLTAYKNALQGVADNYPNSEEGKSAQEILNTQIPFLEQMNFNTTDTKNWKILYKISAKDDKRAKEIEEKVKKFNEIENLYKLSCSFDNYNDKEKFVTVHGLKSESYAKDIALAMKENKKYSITEPAIVISNENYKVIQIKKNLDVYLASKNQ